MVGDKKFWAQDFIVFTVYRRGGGGGDDSEIAPLLRLLLQKKEKKKGEGKASGKVVAACRRISRCLDRKKILNIVQNKIEFTYPLIFWLLGLFREK